MFRKRRRPTPGFKIPPPYNPITGEYAPVGIPRDLTRTALFQVCEEDTHDNYLVCRGYDPDARKYYDGVTGTVSVAKPYGLRGTNTYQIAEVLACLKPQTGPRSLGENPGVAATTMGQPADLDEVINLLYDDYGVAIAWMHVGTDMPARWIRFRLTAELTTADETGTAEVIEYFGGPDPDPEGAGVTVYNNFDHTNVTYIFEGATGHYGWARWQRNEEDDGPTWHIFQKECPEDPDEATKQVLMLA